MSAPNKDETCVDQEDVVNRLIAEQAETRIYLNELKLILNSKPEFEGLSLKGGLKALIKRYYEEKDKNFKLEKELKTLMRKES